MTATIDAEPQIIKTDTRGRVQTSPERREQLLAEFERSGLSGPKFAALVGIKYPTFAAWAVRRRRQQTAGNPAPPGGGGIRELRSMNRGRVKRAGIGAGDSA